MDKTSHHILVAGAGRIGQTLAALLSSRRQTRVTLFDHKTKTLVPPLKRIPSLKLQQGDVSDTQTLSTLIQQQSIDTLICCLSYQYNLALAQVAKAHHCHYFDLNEDITTTTRILSLSKDASPAFVPQCGIAPGFINLIANDLIQQCDHANSVTLYCGALPQSKNTPLGYALNWSTEGLINEYGNRCRILRNGQLIHAPGLSGLERITLDQDHFEAFHTSGGIGTLVDTYKDTVSDMAYKSIRYPGHCQKMQFLMNELQLNQDRQTLKHILENAIPPTQHDFLMIHIVVKGEKNKSPLVLTDSRRFYPTTLSGMTCTAIQATTSSAAAAVIDIVLSQPQHYQGPIKQEAFNLLELRNNPLASYLFKN